MKKHIIFTVIFSIMFVSIAFASQNGENLFGQNACQKVDKNHQTKITSVSFTSSELVKSGDSYRYSAVVVGYPDTLFIRGIFNGKSLATASIVPFSCTKEYSTTATNNFSGGRVFTWYIPASYVNDKNNFFEMNINGIFVANNNIKKP